MRDWSSYDLPEIDKIHHERVEKNLIFLVYRAFMVW